MFILIEHLKKIDAFKPYSNFATVVIYHRQERLFPLVTQERVHPIFNFIAG